jgi:16S rRNA (guanine966-N2)-methyltransferase
VSKKINERRNSIRIIGGTLRGRVVHFPDLPGLRPTPDRVRETLFNWLMYEIHEVRVLDLFSGSGALGIEALSRGAEKVTFVEKNSASIDLIRQHLEQFKIPASRYELYLGDALAYLDQAKQKGTPFEVIFLDPPFSQGWIAKVLPGCVSCLSPSGKIYLEHEVDLVKESYWLDSLEILKEKKAGDVNYILLTNEGAGL